MDNFVELRQLTAMLLKRWLLLVLGAAIGGLVGYTLSQTQQPVYEATTTLIVGRMTTDTNVERADILLSEQLVPTYANLVRRRPVLENVVTQLQLPESWLALKERVRVRPIEGTQLFEINVTASSSAQAVAIADAIAYQIVLLSPASARTIADESTKAFINRRLENLQKYIDAGQQQLDELEAEQAAMIGVLPAVREELRETIQTLQANITDWDNSYSRLLAFTREAQASNQLVIIEMATANPFPLRPRTELVTLVALILGLGLATGLIFILENLDDTIRAEEDLSQRLGLPTLGKIRPIPGKSLQHQLLINHDIFSSMSEDYRLLRSKLQFMFTDWPHKAIMLTSPSSTDLNSVMVANLGIVLAQAGFRTIIVDADLRRPIQHKLFGLPNQRGLTDLLYAPTLNYEGHLQNTAVTYLQLISAGTMLHYPSEVLGSLRMKQIVADLLEEADILLCDSAQAVAFADASVLSGQVDGVLLVVESGKDRRSEAKQALYNLQQAGATLLGAILSAAPFNQPPVKTEAVTPVIGGYLPNENGQATARSLINNARSDTHFNIDSN